MRRRSRLALLAAAVGLIVPTAVSTAAQAVEQDLALSATSGAAGAEVTVTSASCPTQESEDGFGFLQVRLLSGTGADTVLAGLAIGQEDMTATLVIPDWVDPTDDAVVLATCFAYTFANGQVGVEEFAYDPVAFDIEGSPGTPVQARTYNRTSLMAGQAFSIEGAGCFIDDPTEAFTEVAVGADLSFDPDADYVTGNATEVDGGAFTLLAAMSNGTYDVELDFDQNPATVQSITEYPTDLAPGTYSSITYCLNEAGAILVFEPQLIEITGDAPFGDLDLTVPAGSRTATLAGASCTDEVSVDLWAEDLYDPYLEELDADTSTAAVSPLSGIRTETPGAVAAWLDGETGSSRALNGNEGVSTVVTPDGSGAWTLSEEVELDNALVDAYAWCGDPLGDGYIYDPQVAAVEVEPDVTTTTTTTVVVAPLPLPAESIPGTPNYAG